MEDKNSTLARALVIGVSYLRDRPSGGREHEVEVVVVAEERSSSIGHALVGSPRGPACCAESSDGSPMGCES